MEKWLSRAKTMDDLLTGADGEEAARWLKGKLPTAKGWVLIVDDGVDSEYVTYGTDAECVYMMELVKHDFMFGED